jgi:hypothetical protein
MFLGWYDPDRRKTLERKLDDALDRYREKFNAEPVTVLTSIADADSLQKAALQRNLLLKGVRFVSGSTFLVGSEDESDRAVDRTAEDSTEPGSDQNQAPEPAPKKSRRRKRQP